MTTPSGQDVDRIARDWAIRMRDPKFDAWENFTCWLEISPLNAAAFDRVTEDEAWIDELYRTAALETEPDLPADEGSQAVPGGTSPSGGTYVRRRVIWWGGVAAGLMAIVGTWYGVTRDRARIYTTGPGEQRTIALHEGTRIALHGNSALRIENARRVRLEHGEANFAVRHDADNPFTVLVGDDEIVDLGTRFNVVNEDGRLDVAVQNGSVAFRIDGSTAAQLRAGDVLSRARADGAMEIRHLDPAMAGSWQQGYLSYVDTPLGYVAADLGRHLGRRITVDPVMRARVFSGAIMLDGTPETMLTRAAPLLRARFVPKDGGWSMIPADASTDASTSP